VESTTYKILLFMKRRPGMSVESFREYYEERHAPLCLQGGSTMSRRSEARSVTSRRR